MEKIEPNSIVLFGANVVVDYYGLYDTCNMHINYVGDNIFMYRFFYVGSVTCLMTDIHLFLPTI